MLPKSLLKDFDKQRLARLLGVFFLALAIPTGVLIWQAYKQLKWEAFHQYRGAAEELTARVDAGLVDLINTAENRSFGDYSFLVVSGDPNANFLQPSPLAAFPIKDALPGVIGYFQVDSQGEYSTPLLPQSPAEGESYGIARTEYDARKALAVQVQSILQDNRLVQARAELGAALEEFAMELANGEKEAAAITTPLERRLDSGRDDRPVTPDEDQSGAEIALTAQSVGTGARANYSQGVFDELNVATESDRPSSAPSVAARSDDVAAANEDKRRQMTLGRVDDLQLDETLQKKSESAERSRSEGAGIPSATAPLKQAQRAKRVVQDAVAEVSADAVRIRTFESEIDPFEFSLLDSGHLVLFRNVWRDGERYIQGLLLDRAGFIATIVEREFAGTALAQMSNLLVAHGGDVIHSITGRSERLYSNSGAEMQGDLLFQGRLSSPFDRIELVFSINRLPPGPGASILAWVTFVLAIVFLGGYFALYRLGTGQIDVARQQQDFVSAVSHELKTPLTSIRMYGEMLKDGWAEQDKRQQYYEFIHDESERLTRLIANVLQLASISRSEPQLDLRHVRVGTLINQIESKIANQIERAGFALNLRCDEVTASAEINIDEDCFTQIVINLVDNAIKFSNSTVEKTIEIAARRGRDKHVVFSVRDYGPGIAKDQMKKIFRLFYRSESELTRETVGTGIGLAIVHQLTQAMHGSVDVTNKEPGAEFRVSFPAV